MDKIKECYKTKTLVNYLFKPAIKDQMQFKSILKIYTI